MAGRDADSDLADLKAGEAIEQQKKRDAAKRAAAKEIVQVRVLPKGDGQIFTGKHDTETGEMGKYKKGEMVSMTRGTAEEFEERGFVEIGGTAPEATPAPAPTKKAMPQP